MDLTYFTYQLQFTFPWGGVKQLYNVFCVALLSLRK